MTESTRQHTGQESARSSADTNGQPPTNGHEHPDAPNLYQILGVAYTATPRQITEAYRRAMKRIHPDRRSERSRAVAEEEAKTLNLAYGILSKPAKRLAYDREIRAQLVQDQMMNRYVTGADLSGAGRDPLDPTGERLRRFLTEAEQADQRRTDRSALLHMLVIFVILMAAVIAVILLYSVLSALIRAVL